MTTGTEPIERLYRPEEVAQLLGITVPALANWRSAGTGPTWVKISPRAVRYRPSAVAAWIAAQEEAS